MHFRSTCLNKLFICLLPLLTLWGCSKTFNRDFNGLAVQCGLSPAELQDDENIYKIMDPAGSELAPEDIATLQVRVIQHNGSMDKPAVSSRGCVRAKLGQAVLQAVVMSRNYSSARPTLAVRSKQLQLMPLQSSAKIIVDLECPRSGYVSHNRLRFPLRFSGNASMQTAQISLTAVASESKKTYELFRKDYGFDTVPSFGDLDTSALPEGTYELQLQFLDSSRAWDLPGLSPDRIDRCALTILHSRPQVGGLDSYPLHEGVALFRQGQILPWKTTSDRSRLLACEEKRDATTAPRDTVETAGGCSPRNSCRSLENFHKQSPIVASTMGLFDYFVIAEDEAGNQSPLSCQTVLVTDQKPKLDLRWAKSDWNKPLYFIEQPENLLELRIYAKHPELANYNLSGPLECKVDFLRSDRSILPGSGILCAEGICQGQRMDNFVACPLDLKLSLSSFWGSLNKESGFLRVHVRSLDELHPLEESTAVLGIQPQRWNMSPLPPKDSRLEAIDSLVSDRDGNIFIAAGKSLARWDETEQNWLSLQPATFRIDALESNVWTSGTGLLFAQQKPVDPAAPTPVYQFINSAWNVVKDPLSAGSSCLEPQALPRDGFWCQNETEILIYSAERWIRIARSTLPSLCSDPNNKIFLAHGKDQATWIACGSQVMTRSSESSAWSKTAFDDHVDALPILNLVGDGQGQVWLLRGRSPRDLQILRGNSNGFKEISKPSLAGWSDILGYEFVSGPQGQIAFGPYLWNSTGEYWEIFEGLKGHDPEVKLFPKFTVLGQIYWISEFGLYWWNGSNLENWGSSIVGPFPAVSLDRQGRLWSTIYSNTKEGFIPLRLERKNWTFIPNPPKLPTSLISNAWLSAHGGLDVYFKSGGLYRFESDRWNRVLSAPLLEDEQTLSLPAFEPYIISPDGIVYRDLDSNSWERLNTPNPRTYLPNAVKDQQGRIWIHHENPEGFSIIKNKRIETLDLKSSYGRRILKILSSGGTVLAATDLGLLQWQDDRGDWKFRSWAEMSLQNASAVFEFDRERLLIASIDDRTGYTTAYTMHLDTGETQSFPLPGPNFYPTIFRRLAPDRFIFSDHWNVYYQKGDKQEKIFGRDDIAEVPAPMLPTFNAIFDIKAYDSTRALLTFGEAVVLLTLPES